jgi:hypothetical protein
MLELLCDCIERVELDGLDAITSQDVQQLRCEACIMGKGTRLPSPPAEDIQASNPGELVYINIWDRPALCPWVGLDISSPAMMTTRGRSTSSSSSRSQAHFRQSRSNCLG